MDIGKGITRSVNAYLQNFLPLFLATLLVFAVGGIIFAVLNWSFALIIGIFGFGVIGRLIGTVLTPIPAVVTAFLMGPLLGGLLMMCLKILRGEKADFHQVLAYFDKLMPAGMVAGLLALIITILQLIGSIPVLGTIISIAYLLAIPAISLVFLGALGFVVDKGVKPLDAIQEALGRYLADPIMLWIYALVVGIMASLGVIPYWIIAVLLGAIAGLFGVILSIIFAIPCFALTMPFGLLGLGAAYEEKAAVAPRPVKLDRQVVQITGLSLVILLLIAVLGRAIWGWGYGFLSLPGVGSFGARSSIFNFGGMRFSGNDRSGKVQFKTDKGTVTWGAGEGLPADFPKDIPIYKGAKAESYLSGSGPSGAGLTAILSSKDAIERISQYYQSNLASNGWQTEVSSFGGELTIISATKDTRKCSVTLNKDEKGTNITISLDR